MTVAADKKSAEIELYDALKSKTTYSIDVKVGDQTLNAELDFVIGEVAQIIAEDQTIPANKESKDEEKHTIDATELDDGKTYTVKVLINDLEVFSNTFTVKDSTKYPTLRLTASTVEIDIDGEDNNLEAALEKILEVTAPNGTLASKATVLNVEFVSDNESVIVDKGEDKSSPEKLGNATVAVSEVKIDLDGNTEDTTDQYTIKFTSNLNVVVVDKTVKDLNIDSTDGTTFKVTSLEDLKAVEVVSAETTPGLGTISVAFDANNDAKTATFTSETSASEDGEKVTFKVTDKAGNTATYVATWNAESKWTLAKK